VPTILTHPAVPLAVGLGLGSGVVSRRLLAAGVFFSIAPDFDVYAHLVPSGFISGMSHRAVTHSLVFALLCALLAALIAPRLQTTRLTAFWFVALATASHGFLDAFTNGGSGIEFFWPFHKEGYFMPVQPIEVSPLGILPFFSERGLAVIVSELTWVWPPAIALGLAIYGLRRALAERA
jgi:inner membrane protein